MEYWEFHGDLEDFEISMGYSLFESVEDLSSEQIKQALLRRRGKPASKYSIGANAGQFLLFQEIAVNDIAVVRDRRRTGNIRICRVTGPYDFDESTQGNDHAHSHPVEWLTLPLSRDGLPATLRAILKKRMLTIRRIDDPAVARAVRLLIDGSPRPSFTAKRGGYPGRPRSATAGTIAQFQTPEDHDEGSMTGGRPSDLRRANRRRRQRTSDHARLVRAFARKLPVKCMFEHDFDLAARMSSGVLLAEMKTLDGDEVRQVRHAVGQLLYYEKLSLSGEIAGPPVTKVAVFDERPTSKHVRWMEGLRVAVAWREGDEFFATQRSKDLVGLTFLRTEERA